MTASGFLTEEERVAQERASFARMFALSLQDRDELAGLDDAALAGEVARLDEEIVVARAHAAWAEGRHRRGLLEQALDRVRAVPLAPPESVRTPEAAAEHLLRAAAAWVVMHDAKFERAMRGELGRPPAGFRDEDACAGGYGAQVRLLQAARIRLVNERQAREYERVGADPREPLPGPEAAAREPRVAGLVPAEAPLPARLGEDYCVECGSRLAAGHFDGCPVLDGVGGSS